MTAPVHSARVTVHVRGRIFLLAAMIAASCGGSREESRRRHGLFEVVYAFTEKDAPDRYIQVDSDAVRRALADAGESDAEVVATMADRDGQKVYAVLIRTRLGEDVSVDRREQVVAALKELYGTEIQRIAWSGDRLVVRSASALPVDRVRAVLDQSGFEMTKHESFEGDLGEHDAYFAVGGRELLFERVIERRIGGVDAIAVSVEMVGPAVR